nr:nero [Cucujiformia]
AIEVLIKVLEDVTQEPMVRHEAGEALGAIGSPQVKQILEKYSKDPIIEVAETCELALNRIKWLEENSKNETINSENPYNSVDPAPPATIENVTDLKTLLLNENAPLFDRYRAMFSLRNLRTKDSVVALSAGLKCHSALFRHEIAFVLGQMQHESSVPYLKESLVDLNENE